MHNNIKMSLTHIRKGNAVRFVTGSIKRLPIPVATQSKAWVCSFSLTGIARSNTTGGMDVCRECCVVR